MDEGLNEKPLLEEIDFDQKTLETKIRSEYGNAGSESSKSSKANTQKTLPSYQGDYEARSEVRKIPSQKFPSPPKMDGVNLTAALMSAPIQCTLPLADVLRVKPELWKELGKYLKHVGINIPVSAIRSLA